jgi:hypothetical protein
MYHRGDQLFIHRDQFQSSGEHVAPIKSVFRYSALCIIAIVAAESVAAQSVNEVLGRPTDSTVTISILFNQNMDVYWEYGLASGAYTAASRTVEASQQVPLEFDLAGLRPDTKYYYRARYRTAGSGGGFSSGDEHIFRTQRAKGSTFRFTVEADPHPYDKKGSHTLWYIALKNQLNDQADFMLDLGDTFGDDHTPFTITSNDVRQLHLDCRAFFGSVAHSLPLFLCLGNHEGESGYYLLQTPPSNLGVYGTLWRKFYYPNPFPNRFYSGNTVEEQYGIGLPENYYAWEWGDALFVVLDAYRGYTANAKPRGWEWTLGKDQYDWLKRTLEESKAPFKFVFAHHTLGETRGGTVTAKLHEWGGYESDKSTWGFTANRPGWDLPIHQLMVKNGVNIFFQGHDHLFAKEIVDGIVYQEVPMPSDSTYIIGTRDNGSAYTDLTMDASGHLRVTVSPALVTVEYVRAWLPADETAQRKNGEIAYSYTVSSSVSRAAEVPGVPSSFVLEQNFPNPFNPATTISYQLNTAGMVSLYVYDVLGKEIVRLTDEQQQPGRYSRTFSGKDLPSGVYIYRLTVNGSVLSKRAVLMK